LGRNIVTPDSPYIGGEGWAPPRAFRLYSAAPLESPVGRSANTLDSLREGIASAPQASLFHHVTRMPARFPHARDVPENDFARWVGDALQLPAVAERLAFAGSGNPGSIEDLRSGLLAVLDSASERDRKREAAEGASFQFISSRSIEFPLEMEAADPDALVELWPRIDPGAAFYHLAEAALLGPAERSVVAWLKERDADGLAEIAEGLVRAAPPLARLHKDLGTRWRRSMIGRRLARRATSPEHQRQREARDAMARLAGRLRGGAEDGKP
jgi:hypothetical protein